MMHFIGDLSIDSALVNDRETLCGTVQQGGFSETLVRQCET